MMRVILTHDDGADISLTPDVKKEREKKKSQDKK